MQTIPEYTLALEAPTDADGERAPRRGEGDFQRMDVSDPTSRSGLLSCPTPLSSQRPLITHRISTSVCETRQRQGYHKCFSCAISGLRSARDRQTFQERATLALEPAPILQGPGSPVRTGPAERVPSYPPVVREEPARALPRV